MRGSTKFGIVCVVALCAALVAGLRAAASHSARTRISGYPELEGVDPSIAWGDIGPHLWIRDSEVQRIAERLRDSDELVERSFLAGLLANARDSDGESLGKPAAVILAAQQVGRSGSAQVRELQARMVCDRRLSTDVRYAALSGLSCDGDADAAGALVRCALDDDLEPTFRNLVLRRLPGTKAHLPPDLKVLLYLPFHRLDLLAAAALAQCKDAAAPSLVIEGLRTRWHETDDAQFVVDAAMAMAPDDRSVREAAEEAKSELGHHTDAAGYLVAPSLERLAAALETWMTRHPFATDTPFERERTAYLRSERRRRELRSDSVEQVLSGDFDFAAAAMFLTSDREAVGRRLEALDRLCRLIARELPERRDPEAVVAVVARRALGRWGIVSGMELDDDAEYTLAANLQCHAGNCAARSALHVAIADRLGLPLEIMELPRHIFVRWNDGAVTRNIETTDHDREIDAREMLQRNGGTPVPCSKVRLLSALISNLCVNRIRYGQRPEARRFCDLALALDGRNLSARVFHVVTNVGVLPADALDHELDGVLEDGGNRYDALCGCAYASLEMSQPQRALDFADAALRQRPDDVTAAFLRAKALLGVGRPDEATTFLQSVCERWPRDAECQGKLLAARIASGDRNWRDDAPEDWSCIPEVVVEVAEALITEGPSHPSEPHAALDVLTPMQKMKFESPEPHRRRGLWSQRRSFEIEARAWERLGDAARARAAGEKAAALSETGK